jgi:Icc-related predicted phosphoesterase
MNTVAKLKNYDFNQITLLTPRPLQGGTYFSKVVENGDNLLVQTPKIYTKKGIHKTGKKTYCDLLFSIDDSIILDWVKKMEDRIRDIIYEKREFWFYDELTLDDIEYNWIQSIKNYKKKFLCRTTLNKTLDSLRIFNESGTEMSIGDLKPEAKIICILQINGLKFNSTSFHIEFGIKQIMMLDDTNKFDKCLIKYNTAPRIEINESEEENKKQEDVAEKELVEEVEEEEVEVPAPKEEELLEDVEQGQETVDEVVEPEEEEETEIIANMGEKDEEKENNVKKEIEEFINEKETRKKDLEKNEELEEFVLEIPKNEGVMNLRDPNEIYLDIYKAAKEKARQAKLAAVKAYLEAKKIKQSYLIDELDTSDDDSEFDDEVFSEK